MTEEIKEILNTFKELTEDYSVSSLLDFEEYEIPCIQLKMVLDYITNLQEENKEYSMIFDTFSKRPYAHKYLEEKKKKLNNNKIIGLDSEMVYKDYYDYKQRIDKIIAYLGNCDWNNKDFEKIYDIAMGSDEE